MQYSFSYFPVFGSIKKISKRKTIFTQRKRYGLFLEIVFHFFFFFCQNNSTSQRAKQGKLRDYFSTYLGLLPNRWLWDSFIENVFSQNNSFSGKKKKSLLKQTKRTILWRIDITHVLGLCSEFQILWEIYVIFIICYFGTIVKNFITLLLVDIFLCFQ